MSLYFVSGFISAPIIRRYIDPLLIFCLQWMKYENIFLKCYEYITQAVSLAMF